MSQRKWKPEGKRTQVPALSSHTSSVPVWSSSPPVSMEEDPSSWPKLWIPPPPLSPLHRLSLCDLVSSNHRWHLPVGIETYSSLNRLKKENTGLQHCLGFRWPLHSLLLPGPTFLEESSVFVASISSLLPRPPASPAWLCTNDPTNTALARAAGCLPVLLLPSSSDRFAFFSSVTSRQWEHWMCSHFGLPRPCPAPRASLPHCPLQVLLTHL